MQDALDRGRQIMETNIILGTASTILISFIYCIGRFQKNKKAILTLDLLAKILTVMMFFFFGQKTGIYTELIGLTVIIAANIKERTDSEFKHLYILYMMIYAVILLTTSSGLSSVLVTAVAMISVTSNWWFDAQKMRIADIAICALMFVLDIRMGNYAGITELIIMSCNIASFVKYRNEEEFTEALSQMCAENTLNSRYFRRLMISLMVK